MSMHATHRLYSQSEFEPPVNTPDDNGGGTKNVEFEPGSKDGADESEISGIDDGRKNSATTMNGTEDVGVANEETGEGGTNDKGEETGAGGYNEKGGEAANQPQSTQEGCNFDKMTGNIAQSTQEGCNFDKMTGNIAEGKGKKQASPGTKRGKSHQALLNTHKRLDNGMCLVRKVLSVKGFGVNKQVLLKWETGEESWQSFTSPYEDLTDEIGELNIVFICLHLTIN